MTEAARDPSRERSLRQRSGTCGAWIDDGDDLHARALQIKRCCISRVIVGENDGPRAGANGILIDVGAHRSGQHDVWPIVIRENQRSLDRACREHHLPSTDQPHRLPNPGYRRLGQVIGDALDNGDEVMVVIAECGGAAQKANLRQSTQLGERRRQPRLRWRIAKGRVLARQRASECRHFVHKNDACPGPAGGKRRGEAGGTASHHEHIAMRVALFVMIGIGFFRDVAHSGGVADEMLIEPPRTFRAHKGLVIEPRRQQRRRE